MTPVQGISTVDPTYCVNTGPALGNTKRADHNYIRSGHVLWPHFSFADLDYADDVYGFAR